MAEKVLLDASALLALAYQEPGAATVAGAMVGGAMSVVNWSEALGKWMASGGDGAKLAATMGTAGVRLEEVRPADAWAAAELQVAHPRSGLSLGDRLCLATGKRLRVPVLTADRTWNEVAHGIHVRVIR